MLLVNGDFEKVKAEMKEAYKAKADVARALKKLHKKPYERPVFVNQKIDALEKLQGIYKVSQVLPVRIEGLIINYKLFNAYIKKLRGFKVELFLFLEDEFLVLEYQKDQTKGLLELRDLSQYFKGFDHIPCAEVQK